MVKLLIMLMVDRFGDDGGGDAAGRAFSMGLVTAPNVYIGFEGSFC